MGIAQIRPDSTALEIEQAGLLYAIGCDDDINWEPIQANVGNEWEIGLVHIGPDVGGAVVVGIKDTSRRHRVERLLDPAWGIEYLAANMHYAVTRPGFFDNWRWPQGTLDRSMTTSEKMAVWHTQGIFDLEDPKSVDDGNGGQITMGVKLQNYLHLVSNVKKALRELQIMSTTDWEAQ